MVEKSERFSHCKCFTSEEKYDLIGHAIAVSMEYYRMRLSELPAEEDKKELMIQKAKIKRLDDMLRNTPICP